MGWVRTWKPASTRAGRLLLAAVVWFLVGAGLAATGARWLLAEPTPRVWVVFLLALAVGWAKARWVLGRAASRNARRILASGEDRCIGGAFTWGTWAVAVSFMALGFFLRRSSLPRSWIGAIYIAAGAALVLASRVAWRYWRELRGTAIGPSF